METTFIALQVPIGETFRLYNRSLSATEQSDSIPTVFRDSMLIREHVFVDEMRVISLAHHLDTDEARCWHWTLYVSSSTAGLNRPQPVGTIRLLPFPQHPKPEAGSRFEAPPPEAPVVNDEAFFSASPPLYTLDSVTTPHDGAEPFLKLGRMCIMKKFRGKAFANLLVQAALAWAAENPSAFQREGSPQWKGLVYCHATEHACSMWQRTGFEVDEKMGVCYEAGTPHRGMLTRVKLKDPGH